MIYKRRMNMNADELLSLKQKIDRLRTDIAALDGALDQLLLRLKTECNVSSLEKGQRKLDKLTEQLSEKESSLEVALRLFEEKYAKYL